MDKADISKMLTAQKKRQDTCFHEKVHNQFHFRNNVCFGRKRTNFWPPRRIKRTCTQCSLSWKEKPVHDGNRWVFRILPSAEVDSIRFPPSSYTGSPSMQKVNKKWQMI